MLYGAYRLLRLGLLVDSRGLSGAEPEDSTRTGRSPVVVPGTGGYRRPGARLGGGAQLMRVFVVTKAQNKATL